MYHNLAYFTYLQNLNTSSTPFHLQMLRFVPDGLSSLHHLDCS